MPAIRWIAFAACRPVAGRNEPVAARMYLAYFQLKDHPFRLTPDLAYRYDQNSQLAALTMLRIALEHGAGFIKVIGEVGLGKTLLCRTLLEQLQPPFVTAWLPDPHLSPVTLRTALARDLGIKLPKRPSQHHVHELLQKRLTTMAADGKRPVLLIDEAQALPNHTLETVRLLTNLETEKRKLLQVVLFAQPQLDRRLANREFWQLRQRIAWSCRIQPLDRRDVEKYIEHRLRTAGARQELFSKAAVRRIAGASGGVPRLVNILCDKTLLVAYGRGKPRAGLREARRAIADTESVRGRRWWSGLRPIFGLATFGLLALSVLLLLGRMRGSGA